MNPSTTSPVDSIGPEARAEGATYYRLDYDDLVRLSEHLSHAAALVGYTCWAESCAAYLQMSNGARLDYLRVVHAGVEAAQEALGKVMLTALHDPDEFYADVDTLRKGVAHG